MLITSSACKFFKRKSSIALNGNLIDLTSPVVMGILNVSPDSFYDGGKYKTADEIVKRAEQIVEEGATIIDIGAISTRPGSEAVSTQVEMERLLPAVEVVRKRFPDMPMSIDTFRSWVAMRVIDEYGDCIVNDISGGNFDQNMFETIARLDVPYVLMHILGTPKDMQEAPQYNDVVQDVSRYFSDKVRLLAKYGVKDVILDPGFGFGKNLNDSYDLLNRLDSFKVFQLPVMVGISRKSMIYTALETDPDGALTGTVAVNMMALLGGAEIIRVHDVKEAVATVKLFKILKSVAQK
ncbi:MAG: dihydropteroate synthase [Bacteroidales bacterium]|jgi:dihydropteroate synthase|nr:dihydropteroate synthase [Bacteroidales bacterium]